MLSWYNYVMCFFIGVFFANFIPHFVHGISGDAFPTPFAKPHGKGLSSPLLNIIWGLLNAVFVLVLIWYSHFSFSDILCTVSAFIGISVMGIRLSLVFAKKDKK